MDRFTRHRRPREGTEIVYEYGARPSPNKPLKERVYGDVSTKDVRVHDHVFEFEGKIYFCESDAAYPPTDWQVHEIARESIKSDGTSRTHFLYDIMYRGARVARARSWADVQRKLGVDLPMVRACRIQHQ